MYRTTVILLASFLALALPAAGAAESRLSAGPSLGSFFGASIGLDLRDGRLVAAWADNSAALPGNPDRPALDVAFAALGGPAVNVTGLPGSQAGVSLAVDPTDPDRLVLAAADDVDAAVPSTLRAFSRDGGATWSVVRGLPGNFGTFSPDVAFDAFGTAWLAVVHDPTFGDPRVELHRSTDGGATFAPVPLPEVQGLETAVSVAAGFGSVWLAYGGHDGAGVRVGTLAAAVGPSGEVGPFAEQTLGPGDTPDIALGPGGRALVVHGRDPFAQNPSVAARVDADGLGAAGFGPAATVANVAAYPHAPTPRAAVDPASGRAYAVWADEQEEGNEDVLLAFDDGGGWSAALRVNAAVASAARLLPRVAVDPASGAVGVAWYDFRSGGAEVFADLRPGVVAPAEPRQPLDLSATAASQTRIDLRWTDASGNETGFQVERDGAVVASLPAGTTAHSDSGLAAGTAHAYRVRAVNAAGPSLWSNRATATTLAVPPAAPSGLVAHGVSFQRIDLTWTAGAGADHYEIESSRDGVSFAFHRLSSTTTAMLFGLEPETTYFFRVRGVNSGGASPYSNVASARTVASAPLPPSGLTATAVSRARIDLAWSDGSTDEDRFEIERSTDGRSFKPLAAVGPNVTRFSDTSKLRPATAYTYRVRACNAAGCSPPASPATASTPAR